MATRNQTGSAYRVIAHPRTAVVPRPGRSSTASCSSPASSRRTISTTRPNLAQLELPPLPSNRPSTSFSTPPPPPPTIAHSKATPDYPVYYSSHPHISRSPTAPPPLRKRPPALVKRPALKLAAKPKSAFEDELDEYNEAEQSLPIHPDTGKARETDLVEDGEQWRDPRTLPCATLARAVRAGEWSEARRQLTLLHDRGAGALESHIYAGAAVDSLTTNELETAEERLEWFLHWYSLVPTFTGREGTYQTSAFVQQNARLVDLLLLFPTELGHLSRILVLFGEKRYAGFFGPLLFPHLVVFGPPSQAMDLWAAVSDASGWSSSNRNRHVLANIAILELLRGGSFHHAVEAVVRVRASCASRSVTKRNGVPLTRPPVTFKVYRELRKLVERHWGSTHPYVLAAHHWSAIDHPEGGSGSDVELGEWIDHGIGRGRSPPDDDRPQVTWVPNRHELPKAIRTLLISSSSPSIHSIKHVLEGIYALDSPRTNLLGLLHRRISGITQVGPELDPLSAEHDWIAAEMIRLKDQKNPHEALRLFASRYVWVGLSTGPRWDEYRYVRTSTQEDVGLSEELIGQALSGIRRKYIPPPFMIGLANEMIVIIDYDANEEGWLEEDYLSMIANSEPRKGHHSSPQTIDPTPTVSIEQLFSFSTEPLLALESPRSPSSSDSLVSSSVDETALAPAGSEPPVKFTAWSSPECAFALPPVLLPVRTMFMPWLEYYARLNPTRAMAILHEMTVRKIHTDALDWSLVLDGFVNNGMIDFAMTGLETMEREGGIELHRPRLPRNGRSTLGPIEPLAKDEDPADQPTPPEGCRLSPRGRPVPPAISQVYVCLISRAERGQRNAFYEQEEWLGSTETSRMFEQKMYDAGVFLAEKEKRTMLVVYARRHRRAVARALAEGRVPPDESEREFSPWGHPIHQALEWDELGFETGSREKPSKTAEWAMTAVDDGMPVQSRLRRMLDESKRAARRRALFEARAKSRQNRQGLLPKPDLSTLRLQGASLEGSRP